MNKHADELSKALEQSMEQWGNIAIKSLQDANEQIKRVQDEALKMELEAKFGKDFAEKFMAEHRK